jgi:hypothetical protein
LFVTFLTMVIAKWRKLVAEVSHAFAGRRDRREANKPTPIFVIGRDSKGNWVAREQSGTRGGLFVDRARALKFAKSECGPGSHAILWVSGVLEFDLSAAPTSASEQRLAESVAGKRRADFSWLTRSA